MPKRKRSKDDADAYLATDGSLEALVAYEIAERHKKVLRATKIASRIERQKLGRRVKNALAYNRDEDVKKFGAEIKAIDKIEVPVLVDRHISKTLLKIKLLVNANVLPEGIKNKQHALLDEITATLNSRIFHAKMPRGEMNRMVSKLRLMVEKHVKTEEKNIKLEPEDHIKTEENRIKLEPDDQQHLSYDETHDGASEHVSKPSRASHYQSSAEGHPHLDSGSDEEGDEDGHDMNHSPSRMSVSLSSSPEHSVSPEPRTRNSHQGVPQATNAMFIPSLNGVGYISGSNSDASDLDEEAPRKNRRGQRARQAIWEKKYKEQAKHLQKQNERKKKAKGNDRNEGWDAQLGAVGDTKRESEQQPRAFGNRSARQDAKTKPRSDKREKDDTGSLHPSWAAKKQLKSKESIPMAQFAGKKVVFD